MTGVHSSVDFKVDGFCDMYDSLVQVNIPRVLGHSYTRHKFEVMWAGIYNG